MKLDPLRFECMYQGHPSAAQGLLYGDRFMLYEQLPETLVRYANYTDTADTGDDYLCSVCYAVDAQRRIYVTEVVYSRDATCWWRAITVGAALRGPCRGCAPITG